MQVTIDQAVKVRRFECRVPDPPRLDLNGLLSAHLLSLACDKIDQRGHSGMTLAFVDDAVVFPDLNG